MIRYPFQPITDRLTDALVTIEDAHHVTHEGKHFSSMYSFTVAGAATDNIRLLPPAGIYCHLLYDMMTDNPCDLFLGEGADINVAGPAVTVFNRNRAAPWVSGVLVNSACTLGGGGLGSTLDNLNIQANVRASAGVRSEIEYVLRPSTDYCFQIVAPVGPNVVGWLCMNWCEHDGDIS